MFASLLLSGTDDHQELVVHVLDKPEHGVGGAWHGASFSLFAA